MPKKKKITPDDVLAWLGDCSATPVRDCAELLADLANGSYKPETLESDIRDTLDLN